ncbi:ABC transporter permease [Nocardioides sp. W7]|uniref:ABC transporter permease n=1 Tax=Nocardioides sp. W7 TaxID=2931390 RepID=UPI001FD1976B|nr:ABC transporter permease [Nocardioides sp. W7]
MRAALLAEHRKLVSTRLWWILLLGMGGYLAFIGAVMALSFTVTTEGAGAPPLAGRDAATATYSLVNAIGYVFPLVVGSLSVTTEFRHRTITQTLLVEPRRSVVVAAKLLATVPVGLALGLVGVLALVAASAPVLAWQGDGAFLTDPEVVAVLVLGVLTTALWAVVGAAFGCLLTNQVAAVVVILAFTQLVEPIARLALGAVDALAGVSAYLPGAAADALIGASFFGELGGGDLLPRWGGALVLLGYAALFALAGRLTTFRRDIG